MILKAEGNTQNLLSDSNFPKDTHTILNRSLNVNLETTVCCLTCYTLFFPPNLPSVCPYCETPQSKPCGTQVFGVKKLFHGQAPSVERPLCTFIWKKLSNWIPCPTRQINFKLCSLFFIDWFNPRGNKLAGKQMSVGIVLMNLAGFASHSAKKICSWATTTWGKLTKDIKQLAYYANPQRPGRHPSRHRRLLISFCTRYDAQMDGRSAYAPLPQGRGSRSQCEAVLI
ncbi:hypothetical protein VP01_2887g1 [Puccinia sorghi]|uniref:Uncharacterized protein n=1 Tax=Puccinia sorghi TaxID=27349 RepID=A0A0L6V2D6_9BASI|nr:hypothetical protein VP01_2887g1 [Puccinia sorghi]